MQIRIKPSGHDPFGMVALCILSQLRHRNQNPSSDLPESGAVFGNRVVFFLSGWSWAMGRGPRHESNLLRVVFEKFRVGFLQPRFNLLPQNGQILHDRASSVGETPPAKP